MGKETAQKINKSRAIRRLVIWYKRNSAVTSIVDTAINNNCLTQTQGYHNYRSYSRISFVPNN
jgi:hypothetical protein